MNYQNIIADLKQDEGFRGMPYRDTRGFWTIGYGTKLPIDEREAQLLLEKRLNDTIVELRERLDFFDELPEEAKEIVLNMAYNLGVPKFMHFKRMIAALREGNFKKAAYEMRDSLWYRQVKDRARRLVYRMERLSESI